MATADDSWDDWLLIGGVGLAIAALYLTRVQQVTGQTPRQTLNKLWGATLKGVVKGDPTAGIALGAEMLNRAFEGEYVDESSEYAKWARSQGFNPADPSVMGKYSEQHSSGNVFEQAWTVVKGIF